MIVEKHIFSGGMDGDSAIHLVAQENYLNLMNGRLGVSRYGRLMQVQNYPGTTLLTQSVFPPYGVQLCLGSCVDLARNFILFALFNTHGDHGIYARDVANGIMYAILYDSQVIGGLNFSKSFRIDKNMRVVGDMLYWTDNNNMPRRMNYIAGIKTNHASFVTTVAPYSWPMNQSVIAWIRRPFGLNITATKVTDGSVTENYFRNFAGQFSHRLIYRDGEYTVPGLPSNMLNYNYSTDTFNGCDVAFNINEDFDQDVQKIELLVRYNNDPSYFVINTWDKAVAADAAAIAAHNAGSQALTFRFFNDKIGAAVGDSDSVKPEDPVPITCKTIEMSLNRSFMGNYVRGYNTPAQTSLFIDTISLSTTDSDNASCFKAFSSYQIAIRFRDYYGRKSFIVTNDGCIVTITDRNYNITSYTTQFSWGLSNLLATTEIPDWAYYYDILITKNLRTRYFITGQDFITQYALKNANGTYSYQNLYTGNAYGIALDAALLLSGVGYIMEEGDLCRLYISGNPNAIELPVLAQDGSKIIIGLQNLGDFTVQPQLQFEIYTPYKKSVNEIFYTTGNTYLVSNPGTGSRQYSTTSGNITGDIYRQKVYTSISGTPVVPRYETMSPDNTINVEAWFNIFGEGSLKSSLGQVNKTNFVMFSNTKIQGAQTNGLSSFEALNEKPIPESAGPISKLQLANKIQEQGSIMLAICEKETASMYLGEVQVVGASKNAFLAETEGVIGTINILQGSYGTTVPSSVIEYLGLVFWYDLLNGCYVQYSSAGLEPVSRYLQTRFFKSYATDYLAANANNLDNINGFHHIPSYVDPFHKEVGPALPALIYENYADTLPSYSSVPSYASSIIDRFDIYDQLGKRMSFTYEENKWKSNYEGLGEQYEYLQDRMFSWKDGAMYEHHTNTTNWNTIYGVQYPIRLCLVANLNPSLLKILNDICVDGNNIPNFAVAMATWPNTQITDLAGTDAGWMNGEGNFYCAWLRDRLSPNSSIGGTADQKLFTGDSLTDKAIMVMLEFQQYSNLAIIDFVDIGWMESRGYKQGENNNS